MERTISVNGTGRVATAPDVADVRLGLSVSRSTVAEAREIAATIARRVLAAVTALGVDRIDVRTVSLVVQPEYDYAAGAQTLRGQSVSHQFLVTVRDLSRLGRIVDDGLAAGATTLDGVTFRTADPGAADAAARVEAFRDARARAATLAAEAGVELGPVLAITEAGSTEGPVPIFRGMLAMAEKSTPTPIEAGEGEVVVSVAVVFAIA
jgi:uncharacterized protein